LVIRFLKESWKLPVIPFRCLPILMKVFEKRLPGDRLRP
jgi:hypothetical protein